VGPDVCSLSSLRVHMRRALHTRGLHVWCAYMHTLVRATHTAHVYLFKGRGKGWPASPSLACGCYIWRCFHACTQAYALTQVTCTALALLPLTVLLPPTELQPPSALPSCRFSQLLPFHHLWQRYICSQLDAVLPPANPAHSHLQLQQQQQRKRRKQTPEASQPPQQQQQQQQQQQCNNPSVEATMRALVPLASSAPPQPAARQLSPAQVMAARTQLSQCELHGSVLQVSTSTVINGPSFATGLLPPRNKCSRCSGQIGRAGAKAAGTCIVRSPSLTVRNIWLLTIGRPATIGVETYCD